MNTPRLIGGYKLAHIGIVERVLGHLLPVGAVVHHANGVKADNTHTNLAVLQSRGEHSELHRKMRVRASGGNPWRDRMCCSCGPRPTSEFYVGRDGRYNGECKPCARRNAKARYRYVPVNLRDIAILGGEPSL